MMILFDSHAHLPWEYYKKDFYQVLVNAKASGIQYILNIGTNLETSQDCVKLAQRYPHIYASIGIHPHDTQKLPQDFIEQLKTLAQNPKVKAIGEIGLDFFYKNSPPENQLHIFTQLVQLAKTLNLPLGIHCREAFQECFQILSKEEFYKGVFHCFTGTPTEANKAIEMGFLISISGIVTFKKAQNVHSVVKDIPLKHMLIETDCPYLSPEPFRGKRNEPAFVIYTAKKIAELKKIDIEEVAEVTTENTKKLFGIK